MFTRKILTFLAPHQIKIHKVRVIVSFGLVGYFRGYKDINHLYPNSPRFRQLCICLLSRDMFCFDYVLYSLSYAGSRELVRQWPAVHNQNKIRFLNETFKSW